MGPDSVKAGFQEVSGLGMEITVAEYRAGNSKVNAPMKITGTHKVTDVTLKRGVIGQVDLNQWLNDVATGSQDALKTVTIELLSEDRAATAMRWELTEARPIKWTGPAFNAKGTDVAVVEMTLACEGIRPELP
jgi:phage tail-like protein